MRSLILLALLLFASAALAVEWSTYQNPRFGYVIDIPPEFSGEGEAQNGDGQVFRPAGGTQLLRVYGGNNIEQSFEASVNTAMGYARDAGWALSYERVTPSWASYSGTRNGQILYARAIALCGGEQYAAFELEYPERDLKAMNPVIERLVGSLKPSGAGAGC
ncbi:MAG: hypothetical protein ACYCZU_07505 [Devosia sp.]